MPSLGVVAFVGVVEDATDSAVVLTVSLDFFFCDWVKKGNSGVIV